MHDTLYGDFMNGMNTALLGEKIRDELADSMPELKVCFDHEPKGKRTGKWHATVAYMKDDDDKHPKRARSLSHIDISVLDESNALVLCEIEEGHASPKLMIGDIGNLLLADYVGFKKKEYQINGAHIVLAFKAEEDGRMKEKAELIQKRIEERFGLKGMTLCVICRPNIKALKDDTQDHIMEYLKSRAKVTAP